MNSKTAFMEIGDRETPPDFDPAYVEARPTLKALLAKAPERAHAAMVYIYRQGVATAEVEAKAKAGMTTQELVALTAAGDEVALKILAARESSDAVPEAPRVRFSPSVRAELSRMGRSEQEIVQLEASAEAELAEQTATTGPSVDAETARMGAKMGVTPADIAKYSGEPKGGL
jgi:hypothetical protein